MAERKWTTEQRLAIDTRDRTLLVSAAAGSGKTATLTERIIASILDEKNPRDIGSMLIVTFTNAAVGELRERISAAIKDAAMRDPTNARLEEQLLTVKDARIMTIDSFCNEILRSSAAEVGLSPNYRIADTAEAELLAKSIIESLIDASYEGELSELYTAEEFAALADCLTTTRGERELSEVFRMIYDSLECAEEGPDALLPLIEEYNPERFDKVCGTRAGAYITERVTTAARAYLEIYRKYLPALATGTPKEQKGFAIFTSDEALLVRIAEAKDYTETRLAVTEAQFPSLPGGKGEKGEEYDTLATARGYLKDDIKKFSESFLSYTEEEWRALYAGLYRNLTVLYKFIKKFHELFTAEKRSLAMCEYSDLERYTYSALYAEDGSRTPLARELAEKFSEIYIDEYQDINNLQNRIFEAVSREDNRFMVGDIKQSIYGFRSANPDIFVGMKSAFARLGSDGDYPAASLFMSSNFRCDEPIIDFVNGIFDTAFGLLGKSIGYDEGDRLKFAKLYPEGACPTGSIPEIHLIEKAPSDAEGAAEIAAEAEEDATSCASEAECVAKKIAELIKHEKKADGSPILPHDIAIIMRSTRSRGAEYSEALRAYGIKSSIADNRDFLMSEEILLTLALLNSIDNPRRDVYLASLMCSPLFDFSADELLKIRKCSTAGTLWEALNTYTGMHPEYEKGSRFIESLAKYRRMAEGTTVSSLLSMLYRETGLLALASRYGGKDNLILLHGYARSFERSSFAGLYSFIRYLNSMLEENKTFERASSDGDEDSVRIITAHKSKGLEYPICFFVGTASRLSRSDTARISYAEGFALAMLEKDPSGTAVVSNPVFSATCDYKAMCEYEEELRVLYVVLTRARERLYIYGSCPKKNTEEFLSDIDAKRKLLSPYTARKLSSMLEIILVCRNTGRLIVESAASVAKCADTVPLEECEAALTGNETAKRAAYDTDEFVRRFTYEYAHPELLSIPEKLSVSRLYPEVLDGAADSAVSLDIVSGKKESAEERALLPRFATLSDADESAKRGIATHTVLQFCDFARLETQGAEAELSRLVEEKFISEKDAARVRLDEIDTFVRTPLFAEIRGAKRLYRELRFNVKLPAADFTADKVRAKLLADREILVQGVIDCVIEGDDGSLILIDYKTDRLKKHELSHPEEAKRRLTEAHRLQLSYYEKAVRLMFGRAPKRVGIYSLHLGCEIDVEL